MRSLMVTVKPNSLLKFKILVSLIIFSGASTEKYKENFHYFFCNV